MKKVLLFTLVIVLLISGFEQEINRISGSPDFKVSNKHISLKNNFRNFTEDLSKSITIKIDTSVVESIKETWDTYNNILVIIDEALANLKKAISDESQDVESLTEEARPLKEKLQIEDNKEKIYEYINAKESLTSLFLKLKNLTGIKTATSSLASQFSKDAPLKEFKKILFEEYKSLDFSAPEQWNLKSKTNEGVNRRVYSLADKKLSEVFSEGERKLHSLSDFFAQGRINNYRGVYIFDDPVNSLDDRNIETVAMKILKLVESGHQTIVFTHNLHFLNSLIDTQKDKVNKVERISNQITIIPDSKLGTIQELKGKFNDINSRMKILNCTPNKEDIQSYDLGIIYDLMSGYLEDYIECILFKDVINRYRPNIRVNSLGRLKDMNLGLIEPLLSLYEQTSRKGNRHSHPRDSQKPTYEELDVHVKTLNEKFNYNI